MKKSIRKIIASALAITMTITAIPFSSYAVDELKAPTLGYARKSQYVLFSSGNNAMQLHAANIAINGNLYSGGNLDAYDESISVRGNVYLGGELNKHDYTIWDSYMFEDNTEERLLTDFTDAVVDSLGDNYIVHEYWQTYSNPELENEGNIYAKDGLQFTGNNVTLGGTIISDTYLLISASHALNTASDSEMNLYVANGNIGIYAGDATISGIIYAPNGTVQICGSDVEINGMIIAKEIMISAENLVINENLNLSLAPYVQCYNDQIFVITAGFDTESDLFNVEMFGSIDGGYYSVYTSDDGENYELNGTTSDYEYSFGISENVPELYIKATQTFDNGFVIESNIIKMVFDDEYGYFMYLVDTDGEGLPDLYEHVFGSDINNVDTDGDGLSDFIEVMIIFTDPLYKDSDEDGIEDGDEDYDGDGLTNLQEIAFGTDLTLTDTDDDGLSDYDEIFVYGTDPLNPDSDGDGLKDGDEIAMGLNPLSQDSDGDGVLDNEELFLQTVDNDGLSDFNYENDYTLSIEINAAGYANTSTEVADSGFSYLTEINNAVLGKVVEIGYNANLQADSVSLTFAIPAATANSARQFPDSKELAGMNRYAVFHYSEEYNVMYPVDTIYDNAAHTLTVNTNELGDYFVVDLDQWFYDMDIIPDQTNAILEIFTASIKAMEEHIAADIKETHEYTLDEIMEIFDFSEPFSATEIENPSQTMTIAASAVPYVAAFTAEKKIKPVDVVFIIDCSDNLQDNFENAKQNIIMASETIFGMCDNARIGVIQFWSSKTPVWSGWYSNSQRLSLENHVNSIEQSMVTMNSQHGQALKSAASLTYRSDAAKFNFLVFDENSLWSIDEDEAINESPKIVQQIVNNGINFSILYNHNRTEIQGKFTKLIELTGGYDGSNLGNFSNYIAQHVYNNTDKIDDAVKSEGAYVDVSGDVILGDFSQKTSYITTVYNGETVKDKIFKDGKSDFDNDERTDSEEVDWSGLKRNGNEYTCRTYGEWRMLIEVGSTAGFSNTLMNTKVLTIYSNPWNEDSDGDGLLDGKPTKNYQGIIICPIDPYPLQKTGPANLWKEQGGDSKYEEIPRKLGDWYSAFDTPTPSSPLLLIMPNMSYWMLNQLLQGIHAPILTESGSKILNFKLDNMNMALHSQVETWQKVFGYNKFYDMVFSFGTNGNMEPEKFYFSDDAGTDYVFWIWRGDYLNLGGGAEMGIYKEGIRGFDDDVIHWTWVDFELYMTLSLYKQSGKSLENVFKWAPSDPQWWITGFKPEYTDPDKDKMAIIGSVDFSGHEDMYESFEEKNNIEEYKDILIFDDDLHMVWIMWWGSKVK